MAIRKFHFKLDEVPDPNHAKLRAMAARPLEAMQAAVAHLLRFVCDLAPGTTRVCLRFMYSPKPVDGHPQSRLQVFLGISTSDPQLAHALEILVAHGALTRFFGLRSAACLPIPPGLDAACQVFRRHQALDPLITRDLNANVPDHYFTCSSFKANKGNDYIPLDAVLHGIDEPVVVDIALAPTSITELREQHGNYLVHLQHIGRSWDVLDDLHLTEEPLAEDKYSRNEHVVLAPLHRPDTVAQEVQHEQQKLHETLAHPQLHFHVVVLARHSGTARLVGSTVAEAAFADGTYEICVYTEGAACSQVKHDLEKVELVNPDLIAPLRIQTTVPGYQHLLKLLHVAPVDELVGLFRFPIARGGSLLCMRKNTDPPVTKTGMARINLGWDAAFPDVETQVERGIALTALSRHVCIFGATGSGKTTTLINLLIQLGTLQ